MNNSNTPKWVPKHSSDITKLFVKSRELETQLRLLARKFSTEINLDLVDYYEFQQIIEESRKYLVLSDELQSNFKTQISSSVNRKIQRSPYKILIQKKALIMAENLQKRHYQLIFVIHKIIKTLLDMSSHNNVLINSALNLCNLYNGFAETAQKGDQLLYGANVCSNTHPTLLLHPKRIDVGVILQIVCKSRCELCCHSLISCLLTTCKIQFAVDDDESNTSSIEILRTLTSHLTSPTEKDAVYGSTRQLQPLPSQDGSPSKSQKHLPTSRKHSHPIDFDPNDPAIKFFDDLANEMLEKKKSGESSDEQNMMIRDELLEHLIYEEENFVADVITKCLELCPNSFGDTKSISNPQEIQKWVNRGTRSLWTQIGSTLDHIVLWWSEAPLACRPVICAKQLRDWVLTLSDEDAPEPILSTLIGLGETLTTHITSTIWDQQFRLALVSSALHPNSALQTKSPFKMDIPGTPTGKLWCELLATLTNLCNSCDQNGTIPNELPIVEQIPILHRMDHSVHTMRLWALSKAKSLCSDWNMSTFFRILNGDIKTSLDHLHYLRVPQLVSANPLEVLIKVCVALRSKLISEIRENILKLKETNVACIDILSKICRTYTLATLTLCFPPPKQWQTEQLQSKCGDYVIYFLSEIFLPVLKSTQELEILNLILKIICEAWLDHIYQKRVKFSRCGAINLLKDFDGVAEWIRNCPDVPLEYKEKLTRHDVLKMCEGVGKILLRKPEEVVSIVPTPKYSKKPIEDDEEGDDEKSKLPPEMFVPNQKRWLELRARNRRCLPSACLCSGIAVENT